MKCCDACLIGIMCKKPCDNFIEEINALEEIPYKLWNGDFLMKLLLAPKTLKKKHSKEAWSVYRESLMRYGNRKSAFLNIPLS